MSVAVQVPDTGRGVHKSRASFQKPIAAFVPIGQWVSVFAANGYCLLWRNLNVHIFLHVFEISLISARLTRRLPHGSFGLATMCARLNPLAIVIVLPCQLFPSIVIVNCRDWLVFFNVRSAINALHFVFPLSKLCQSKQQLNNHKS